MGYNVHWFNDDDHPQDFNYDDCLILGSSTEHVKYMPVNGSAHYILHNVNVNAHKFIERGVNPKNVIYIQVYSKDVYKDNSPENLKNISGNYTIKARYADSICLYMPWGTDLLPHEIDCATATNNMDKNGKCVWVGSYNTGTTDIFQNGSELTPYFDVAFACGIQKNVIIPWNTPISFEENVSLIRNSYLAPSINGKWQMDQHYLPCRLFKNISYGHFGITNNEFAHQIFGDLAVYDSDPVTLFHKSIEFKNAPQALGTMQAAMEYVRDHHTYINRINDILQCLAEETE